MDNLAVQSFLALAPLLTIGVLLVGFRWPAKYAMPVGYVVVVAIALLAWGMSVVSIAASTIQGLFFAASLLYVVFGALLLLATLTESGAIRTIREAFASISSDRRVQAIIIAWLFGTFLEGASGFGSAGAVNAPLLLALGFPAMAAVMVVLIVQSVSVSFGALGVPLSIGVSGGLEGAAPVEERLAQLGLTLPQYIDSVTFRVGLLHGVVGTLIPLFVVCLLTGFFGRNRSFGEGLGIWKFALFAGVAMTIPYASVAALLGPEFPSLFGGLLGLGIVVFAARRGFLMPREPWDFAPRSEWEEDWMGDVDPVAEQRRHDDMRLDEPTPDTAGSHMGMAAERAWAPYALVAILLVLTRIPQLPLQEFLSSIAVKWNDIFGTGISGDVQILYLPGFMFLLVIAATYFIQQMSWPEIARSWRITGGQMLGAGVALLFALPLVRIFINSGVDYNSSGLASMPLTLAEGVASLTGSTWPFFSPWIGALGAFVAGSNTVSNLTFSLFQFATAQQIGAVPAVVIAGQAVGGAAGNMITIHNIVAASATVGLLGKEGALIRKVFIPMTYYLLVAGSLVYIWSYGVGFNLGTVALVLTVGSLVTAAILLRRSAKRTPGPANSRTEA